MNIGMRAALLVFAWLGLAAIANAADSSAPVVARSMPKSAATAASVAPAALDIDGDGHCDALTDGLLLVRALSGLTGPALIDGAVASGASRTTDADIGAYIDGMRASLDLDGDGAVDAQTDGMLVVRYLFGLRGAALVTGAIGAGAVRTTAADIEALTLPLTTPPPPPPQLPVIGSFTATPSALAAGQSTTLSWFATDATTYTIDNGVGAVTGAWVSVTPPVGTTTYKLTASSPYGSTSAQVTVASGPPAALVYPDNPATYVKGSAIPPNVPGNAGGPVASYVAIPALPTGLVLDPVTGVITGTPAATQAASTYSVRGTNAYGYAQVALNITIEAAAPSISYADGPWRYTVGTPIAPLVPANAGGPVDTWSISPALPAGLVFDAATGQITGTPSAFAPLRTYSVNATNGGGMGTTSLSIAVDGG